MYSLEGAIAAWWLSQFSDTIMLFLAVQPWHLTMLGSHTA